MELYEIHTKILTPFIDETLATLDAMCDLKGIPGSALMEDLDEYQFKAFAVCIVAKTSGAIEGKVVMHHSMESAVGIGNRVIAKMFGEEANAKEITEDISEALTEFSNTAIGLATRHLSEANLRISFEAPLYIQKKEDSDFLLNGVQEILSIPIDVEGVGQFYISYMLHRKLS